MAIPVWPASLPDLVGIADSSGVDAFYTEPQETVFDDGPPRQRRATAWNEAVHRVTLALDDMVQLQVFKDFVRTGLNNGAKRFQAPVWLADGTRQIRTVRLVKGGHPAVSFAAPQVPRVSMRIGIEDW